MSVLRPHWGLANANRSEIDMHVDPLSWGITHEIYAYSWGYLSGGVEANDGTTILGARKVRLARSH